jgi:hypothetical protein
VQKAAARRALRRRPAPFIKATERKRRQQSGASNVCRKLRHVAFCGGVLIKAIHFARVRVGNDLHVALHDSHMTRHGGRAGNKEETAPAQQREGQEGANK